MKLRTKRVWTEAEIRLNEQSTTLTAKLHGLSCPECESRKYAKRGKEKGNQRYKCGNCGKHFRSTTGCTIHHLHLKPKIQEYLECMNKGMSLRKTAAKCDISLQTAFRWRHRFIKGMYKQPTANLHKNRVVSALVLPFSNKGKPDSESPHPNITSILQIDLEGTTTVHVLGKYGHSASKLINLTQGCTAHIASRSMPKLFKAGPAKCVTEEQVEQIREVTEQIQSWLAKFRGVATKYLANYWRWFALIRQMQLHLSQHSLYMHTCF